MVTTALLKTMTKAEIQAEIDKFNTANENESFSPESISIVLGLSISWLQKKRCEGGGIPFSKLHYRKIVYRKHDVLDYIDRNRINSTSQMTV